LRDNFENEILEEIKRFSAISDKLESQLSEKIEQIEEIKEEYQKSFNIKNKLGYINQLITPVLFLIIVIYILANYII